ECSADGGVDADFAPVDLASGVFLCGDADSAGEKGAGPSHEGNAGRAANAGAHEGDAASDHGPGSDVFPVGADPVAGFLEEALAVGLAVGGEVSVGHGAETERVEPADGVVVGVVVGVGGGRSAGDSGQRVGR